MGQHRALRAAGGAAGVEDRGQIVGHAWVVERLGLLSGRARFGQAPVVDEQRWLGVGDQVSRPRPGSRRCSSAAAPRRSAGTRGRAAPPRRLLDLDGDAVPRRTPNDAKGGRAGRTDDHVAICEADTPRRLEEQVAAGPAGGQGEELDEGPRITGHDRTVTGSPTPVLSVTQRPDNGACTEPRARTCTHDH